MVVLGALAAVMSAASVRSQVNSTPAQNFARIERGRYLAVVADCGACHDSPGGKTPFGGGRPLETPFGIVAAPNITPDRETGIGAWTDDQFDQAVRAGRLPDGSRMYPAMPYPYYTRMTKEDVLAIRGYLRTINPVRNSVTANQLPYPFRIRSVMAFWDWLYFKEGPFRADPSRSAAWNRGAYLAEGPAHCGACHTPKTSLGGDKGGAEFQGYSLQGWFAPDITNDSSRGLSAWSQRDIVEYLKKGHNRFAGASGPMAEEVGDSSSKMSANDLEAIATYFKSRTGQPAQTRQVSTQAPEMRAGAAIYEDLCSGCHKFDGTGVPYLIPSLVNSPAVAAREPTTVIRVVLHGADTVATREEPTAPQMPAYGWQLTDAQVAAVATYVRNSWHHAAAAVSDDDVRKLRRLSD
jgi:mono/diheme cytochrome c family protein